MNRRLDLMCISLRLIEDAIRDTVPGQVATRKIRDEFSRLTYATCTMLLRVFVLAA
jgi:hypothetical protein